MATEAEVADAVARLIADGRLDPDAAEILVERAHGREADLNVWVGYLIQQRHYYNRGLVKA